MAFAVLAVCFFVTLFAGLFVAAYSIYREEHEARVRAESGPELARERDVRGQLDGLNRSRLLLLNHLVSRGQLTDGELVDFCGDNGLEVTTGEMLSGHVTFLTQERTPGPWSVLPRVEAAVRKVLAEFDAPVPGHAPSSSSPPSAT